MGELLRVVGRKGVSVDWSWKNLHGDLLTYVLRYEVADPNAVAHTMKVSAIYMTAATVASMRNARGPH